MRKTMNTKLQTLALVAIGSLLGYAAARIEIPGRAEAAPALFDTARPD
jgi:hypothetical protein